MKTDQKWLEIFNNFITFLRIDSKESTSIDGKGAKLELWDSQRIFLEEVCKGLDKGIRSFLCLKSRQLGISTISLAIDIFWLAMHPGTIGALVTESSGNANVFRQTIRRYVESFPKGFLGKAFMIEKDNVNFMTFSNGSRLDFLVAGTKKKAAFGDGRGYVLVHLTEIASYGSPEALKGFEETFAETHPNRLFIYESTAKGFNHWREMWLEAKRDTLTKKPIFIGWWSKPLNRIAKTDPKYKLYGEHEPDGEERELIDLVKERYHFTVKPEQLAWYRWRMSDGAATDDTMKQNQPWYDEQAFVMSGFSFFQTRSLQKDFARIVEGDDVNGPVQFEAFRIHVGNEFQATVVDKITTYDRIHEVELRVWEQPVRDAQYVIGCDPAFGRNDWKDRHSHSVWRCYADKLVQVAEYATDHVETYQAAWVLAFLAGTYRNCIVNVEVTGGAGRAVLREFDSLRERMRSELYQTTVQNYGWDDFLQNARWYIYNRPDSYGGGGNLKAFDSNGNNKFYMCNSARDSYATNLLQINSAPLIEEMLTVVQDGFSIGAPGRAKDDRVFALMLANLSWTEHVRPRLVSEGYTYDMVTRQESGETSPVNAIVDNLVTNFFKTAEERQQDTDHRPQWMVDRGLA